MPLTARDVVLVLRAKDEASRVVNNVGRSFGFVGGQAYDAGLKMMATGGLLVGAGAALTGFGLALGNVVQDFVSTAITYNQQAALTLTQVDGLTVSLEELKEMGKEVAQDIAVPFEEIQGGLYDIFSSLDVNVKDAEKILRAFSKGAVAGQVDLQAAGRSTIAILNAFGLGADDVNRVMDVQFQLVRKGIGTYEEFATTIGLGLPGAVRAGQDIESLSGMIAFLTRNGLSASRAATSAGRALELFSNPKTVTRLEEMGIAIKDAEGNFAPIESVVGQLAEKFDDMTAPEKAKALEDLFKGAGNRIQARRFWDTAISQSDEFLQRVEEMRDAGGALDEAYAIMANQPGTRLQALKNSWDVLSQTLGDALLPDLMRLVDVAQRAVDWLNALDEPTKVMVARALALSAAAATAVGALTGIAGILLILGGAVKMFGGLAVIVKMGLKFMGWVGLIASAALLVYENWDSVNPKLQKYWPKIQEAIGAFLGWLRTNWNEYWPLFKQALLDVLDWLQAKWIEYWPIIQAKVAEFLDWLEARWNEYWPIFKEAVLGALETIQETWETVWPILKASVEAVLNWIVENWPRLIETYNTVAAAVIAAIIWIRDTAVAFWEKVQEMAAWFWDKFGPGFKDLWEGISEHVIPIIEGLADLIAIAWELIRETYDLYVAPLVGIIQDNWDAIAAIFEAAFDYIVNTVKIAIDMALDILAFFWNTVGSLFENGLQVIRGVIEVIAGVLTGDWERAWEGIKLIFSGIWEAIIDLITNGWELIKGAFENGIRSVVVAWELGLAVMLATLELMWGAIQGIWDTILGWLSALGEELINAASNLVNSLYNTGVQIMGGLKNGLEAGWEDVKGFLGGLNPADWKGPPARDAKMLVGAGQLMMKGLGKGLDRGWDGITRQLQAYTPALGFDISGGYQIGAGAGIGAAKIIQVNEGAVKVEVGSVSSEEDVDKIRNAVDEAFQELIRELSQTSYEVD